MSSARLQRSCREELYIEMEVSKLSKLTVLLGKVVPGFDLANIWDDIKDEVEDSSPVVYEFLDAAVRDDHVAMARVVLESGILVSNLANILGSEAAASAVLNAPAIVGQVSHMMENIDEVLPEEVLVNVMERLHLPRAEKEAPPESPAAAQAERAAEDEEGGGDESEETK